MRNSKILILLIGLIVTLALIATGFGVLGQGSGSHFVFKTMRDQSVDIQGYGIYKYDSVSGASQEISQDFVTLFVGIPLLIVSTFLFSKNLLKGKLLLSGTLAYFLYTYTSMSFGTAFNMLFLAYVALFSLSLFALFLAINTIEIAELPAHFTAKLPTRSLSIFFFILAGFLLLLWSGLVVPAIINAKLPADMASYSTLFIQVLDLGVIVPLAVVTGVLIWKKKAWGFLLSSILLCKLFTMGLALCAMIIGQYIAGVEVLLAGAIVFPFLTITGIVFTFILFRNIEEEVDIFPAEENIILKEIFSRTN